MRSFSLRSFSFCAASALLLTTLMSSIVHRDGNRGSSFLHLSGEKGTTTDKNEEHLHRRVLRGVRAVHDRVLRRKRQRKYKIFFKEKSEKSEKTPKSPSPPSSSSKSTKSPKSPKSSKSSKSSKSKMNETECRSLADVAIVATVSVSDPTSVEKDIGKALDLLDGFDVLCSDSEILNRRALSADTEERRTQTTFNNMTVTTFGTTDDSALPDEAEIQQAIDGVKAVESVGPVQVTEVNQSMSTRKRRTVRTRRLARLRNTSPNIDLGTNKRDSTKDEGGKFDVAAVNLKANIATKSSGLSGSQNPCSSADSLTNFLGQQNGAWNSFSKSNPVCESAAINHIHVMIPFYNLSHKVIQNAVASVLGQDYHSDRLTVWLYDDASDDTITIANACMSTGIVKSFDPPYDEDSSWANMAQAVKTMGFEQTQSGLLCIRSTRHLGPGGSKYVLFGLVKAIAGPNDVLLVLDGDDTLHRKDALKIVNQKYLDTGAFFTYGSYKGRWEEQIKDLPSNVRDGEIEFKPREQTWVYGHPRTFKAHLLEHITKQDFQHSDGSWLIKCTERGFVYRMLELAGPSRIGYIAEKIYSYKFSTTSSTLATVPPEARAAMLSHTISGMKPSEPLVPDLDVVLLVWKRTYLLPSQLVWLQKQIGLGKRQVHLHLVNNNWMASEAVNEIVNKFKEWQAFSDEMKELVSESESAILPLKVTVSHSNRDQVYHNFARFVYVDELRRTKPIDEVVFVDDDQYWPPTFVSTLLKAHQPKSVSTWYGKTFRKEQESGEGGLPSYWKPDAGLTDIITGEIEYDSFKYGGTGGSIFDANLWLLDSQLLRPARDLSSWAKIDDLWASYVIDALLGWNINRISNNVLPIDIGDFHKKKTYYNELKKSVDTSIERELLRLPIPSNGAGILTVATYADTTVDKQAMFESLQTKFKWDIA